jgi:hypothetical protein
MKRKAITRRKTDSYIIKCDDKFVSNAYKVIDDKRVLDLKVNEKVIHAKRFKVFMSIDLIAVFFIALRTMLYFPKSTVSIINVTGRKLSDVCKS